MSESELKPGWLLKALERNRREVEQLPAWIHRKAGVKQVSVDDSTTRAFDEYPVAETRRENRELRQQVADLRRRLERCETALEKIAHTTCDSMLSAHMAGVARRAVLAGQDAQGKCSECNGLRYRVRSNFDGSQSWQEPCLACHGTGQDAKGEV